MLELTRLGIVLEVGGVADLHNANRHKGRQYSHSGVELSVQFPPEVVEHMLFAAREFRRDVGAAAIHGAARRYVELGPAEYQAGELGAQGGEHLVDNDLVLMLAHAQATVVAIGVIGKVLVPLGQVLLPAVLTALQSGTPYTNLALLFLGVAWH